MKSEKPIIWKKEECLVGQCKNLHDKHWWCVPMCAPQGLMTECFNCRKKRVVEIECEYIEPDKMSDFVKNRLRELAI